VDVGSGDVVGELVCVGKIAMFNNELLAFLNACAGDVSRERDSVA